MVDRQIDGQKAEEKRLRALMAGYQARVEATAGRESELTALMRDYETLSQDLRRPEDQAGGREDGRRALEERQVGEQFGRSTRPGFPRSPSARTGR